MDSEGDTARGSEVRISDVGIRASCTGAVWQNYHTAGCEYTLSRRVRCPCHEQEWCPNFTSFTNDSSGAAFNSSVIHHQIRPGTGIYMRADAARLIGVASSRLRRWVEGYTYWPEQSSGTGSRRRRPPIVHRDLPVIDKSI